MIEVSNIKPLTDFLRNAKDHISELKESKQPEVLTVNGEAAVIVQDAESYQEMVNLSQQAIDDARLLKALEDLRAGEAGMTVAEARKKILSSLK